LTTHAQAVHPGRSLRAVDRFEIAFVLAAVHE